MAQLMREAQATLAAVMLFSAGTGIVLGSIIACYQFIRAKRQGRRPDPLIVFKGKAETKTVPIGSLKSIQPAFPG